MNIDAKTFEEYFIKSGEHEPGLRSLDNLIRQYAPSLKPQPSIGMGKATILGYGLTTYKTKSSKTEQMWPILALASQKNYISFYVCAVVDGQYMAEKYQAELGKVNCGKSCIRFKKLEDLNQSALVTMLQEVEARYKNGDLLFGV